MGSKHLLFSILFILSLAVSCGGDSGGGGGDEAQQETGTTGGSGGGTTGGTGGGSTGGSSGAQVTLDSELTSGERQAMVTSANSMGTFIIDGSKVRRFSDVFGGNTSSNVVNYFENRVNYIISETTDLESRVVVQSGPALMRNLEIFASNPSYLLWYFAKANEPDDVKIQINNTPRDIESTRVGVMQIGSVYVRSDTAVQVATLIHEARHSDCTGGALATDIERVNSGLPAENLLCGNLHVECPPGHPYAGTYGCDREPWGAYVVDALYSIAIVETCTNCTEAQKQAAEINAIDVIQRPLYDVEALLNGDFGPPNMSSSSQVR